jgi:hypothetical protein
MAKAINGLASVLREGLKDEAGGGIRKHAGRIRDLNRRRRESGFEFKGLEDR